MKILEEQVKYPVLLLLTQVILSIFILIMVTRIIYVIFHYIFKFEMSWYFIKDIPYFGLINGVGLVGGFMLEEYLSKLKK